MDSDKIIDKTNEAIRKQAEVKDLIYEIKKELVILKRKNRLLEEENSELRRKLIYTKTAEPIKEVEQEIDVVVKDEVKEEPSVHKEVVVITKEEEQIKDVTQVISKPVIEEKPRKSVSTSSLYEFFLGKNIIAKIASVLIFLGFVSFGQIAYISWLNDVGRVILILSVGIIFFLGGYFFDKKENIVFNNAFYAIGLLITFLSITLAFNTYELIGYVTALYLSILFVGLSFAYFYKKRFDFLDTFLFIFYVSIVGYLFIYGEAYLENTFLFHLGLILSLLGFGYILFMYLIKFKAIKDVLSGIGILYFAVAFSIILIIFMVNGYNWFNVTLLIEMMIFMIYMMYLSNYKFLEKTDIYSTFVVISSIIILFSVAAGFSELLSFYNLLDKTIHIILFVIVLLTPMYVYLFLKDKTEPDEFSKLDIYAIVISVLVLIYSFTFSSFLKTESVTPFYLHNMVLGIVVLLVYLLYRFTDKVTYMNIFNVYFAFLVGSGLFRFLFKTFAVFQTSGYDNTISHIFNDPTEYLIYLFSLLIGISLLVTNKMMKKYNREEKYIETLVFYGFNLMISIPIVFLIVDNFYLGLERRYAILMLSIISVFVIMYRYMLNIKIFEIKYLREFKLGVQMLSLLLIIIVSFIYFDHDFRMGIDLFTFFFVLLLNGYLVLPLKELYDYAKEKYDLETVFIVVYMIGVVTQSVFIHRYINFTYDKVFLSSYFMIASALAILYGFRNNLLNVRRIGLGAIYFALIKFFTYDFFGAEFTLTVRMVTYFILGLLLMSIAFMYSYLEKKYGETIK